MHSSKLLHTTEFQNPFIDCSENGHWKAILTSCKEIQTETLQKQTSFAKIVKLLSNTGSDAKMQLFSTIKMFVIKIAFDSSKYGLLMLPIPQMTIFISLQSIKCFETLLYVINWNSFFCSVLEQFCFFQFLKTTTLCFCVVDLPVCRSSPQHVPQLQSHPAEE